MTRDGQRPERIAIVGGGITGLAAAHSVMEANRQLGWNVECTVIEASSRWGGKVQTEAAEGFLVEQGAESLLARKVEAQQFLADLGLADDIVGSNQQGAGTFVVYRGRLEALPDSMFLVAPTRLRPWLQTRLLSPAGKLRAALDLVLPSRPGEEDESLLGLVRRRFGNEVADRFAEPLLASVYGGGSDLSVLATVPELRALEQRHRSLLLGMRAAAAQRKRAAGPGTANPGSPFISLRHGLHSMVSRAVERLDGARLLLETPVTRLTLNGHHQGAPRYQLQLANGSVLESDAVLLTTPAFVTGRLVEDLAPRAAEVLAGISYQDTIVVALAYPRRQIGHALNGTGFLVPESEHRQIIGCTWLSQKWPHTSDPERVLLRCYVGGPDVALLMNLPDEKLIALVHEDLRDLIGAEGAPEFRRVYRWQNGIPHYTVGHLERVRRAEAEVGELPALAIAGAGYRGMGVPDCIRQGQAAAASLLGLEHLPRPSLGGSIEPGGPETSPTEQRPLSSVGA